MSDWPAPSGGVLLLADATSVWGALAARWGELGFEVAPLLALAIDALLLWLVGGALARRLGGGDRAVDCGADRGADLGADLGAVRPLLAAALLALAIVVSGATALGAAGRLSHRGLWAIHLALFALVFAPRLGAGPRAAWRALAAAAAYPAAGLWRKARAIASGRSREGNSVATRLLLGTLALVLAFYALLALAAPPHNWDANAYRLPRIALWLQQASLAHLPTNDDRLNFVGHNADLVMLWLVSFFRRGFPLVHLVQFGGGLLACLATVELGAQLGLSRRARLAAAVTLVGIPTVGIQFFTAQSDLFVAGTLAAGLAFLLPALRHGRRGDWLLVGLGVGLAVGAKGTVLYWGPGLAALLVGWALAERGDRRRTLSGIALAAVVALPLCSLNFLQNWATYGNPFAPESAIAQTHLPPASLPPAPAPNAETAAAAAAADESLWQPVGNAAGIVWQLLAPSSNPLLPERWLAPPFDAGLDLLAEQSVHYRLLRKSLAASGGWAAHGLSEDEVSFGLGVTLLALVGGVGAVARARRRRDVAAARWAWVAVSVALFLLVFAAVSRMTIYQYRYFCIVAPFTALLAVAAVRRWRSVAGRGLAVVFVASQAAVALHLGIASEYHGLRAVLDPQRSQYAFLWLDAQAIARELGPRPLAVGLALPRDSWLAPYLRTGVGHRVRLVTDEELTASASIAELVNRTGLDALVYWPQLAPPMGEGVRALPASHVLTWFRRLAVRRLLPGESARPVVTAAALFSDDGWAGRGSRIRLAAWSAGRFEVEVENPSPLVRQVELVSGLSSERFELAAFSSGRVGVAVRADDDVEVRATPTFVPAEHGLGDDRRALGVRVLPASAHALEGVYADGWTAPRARIRLVNWLSGIFELAVSNPAPHPRELELRSGQQSVRAQLAAGATARLAVEVLPLDEVELAVSPALAARALGGAAADRRQLGVLLAGESRSLAATRGER